jgi:hypothetical protein
MLEYALQVHYRGESVIDLAPAILRAWERGVRGSSLADLVPEELSFDPLTDREADTRRRRRAAALGMLSLLAAGVCAAVFWPRARPAPEAPPLVRYDPPTAEELAKADALFRRMIWADVGKVPTFLEWEKLRADSHYAMTDLARQLLLRPPLWEVCEPQLRKTFELPTSDSAVKGVILDLCARERSKHALDLARDFWTEDPAAFGIEHMVAFAENGADEFERELAAVLEDGVALPGQSRVLAAAFFALRGDDRGRAILEEGAQSSEMSREYVPLSFLSAVMLEELGEKGAWNAALDMLSPDLEFLLGAGREDLAFRMVVAAEVFAELRVEPSFPKLCDLAPWIEQRLAERKSDLGTPEAIRAAVGRLLDAR